MQKTVLATNLSDLLDKKRKSLVDGTFQKTSQMLEMERKSLQFAPIRNAVLEIGSVKPEIRFPSGVAISPFAARPLTRERCGITKAQPLGNLPPICSDGQFTYSVSVSWSETFFVGIHEDGFISYMVDRYDRAIRGTEKQHNTADSAVNELLDVIAYYSLID
jgi:hypothetical protein